jgi:hypothetical protein
MRNPNLRWGVSRLLLVSALPFNDEPVDVWRSFLMIPLSFSGSSMSTYYADVPDPVNRCVMHIVTQRDSSIPFKHFLLRKTRMGEVGGRMHTGSGMLMPEEDIRVLVNGRRNVRLRKSR